jgi:hypothetical protein
MIRRLAIPRSHGPGQRPGSQRDRGDVLSTAMLVRTATWRGGAVVGGRHEKLKRTEV